MDFKKIFSVTIFLLLTFSLLLAQESSNIWGKWNLIPEKSSEIALYRTLSVTFEKAGSNIRLIQRWGTRRSFVDTLLFSANGKTSLVPIRNRVFPTNVFMGLSMAVGENRKVKAHWQEKEKSLTLEIEYPLLGSQGKRTVKSLHKFVLSDDGELITYTVQRSTRKTGPEVKYVLKRDGLKEAFVMYLQDGWSIDDRLPENALLITLQGVVNKNGPLLYCIYPDNWPFTYVKSVYNFYKDKKNFTFTKLRNAEHALKTLKKYVKGYVVWDKNVRTSLIVAFTVCGLEKAVAVTEDLIPLMERYSIPMVADFRGKFVGQTDAQIYQWAYEQYFDRCNRDLIIWMGGDYLNNTMKPGVADWGIYKNAFFNDLSTKPSDKEEYELAKKLLSEQNPYSMVMGWHSYKKDKERDHVKLCSSYGLRVEGLHTLPNLSFSSQVPPSPEFKFKNNHNIEPGKKYKPEKKVYIACVQTDGLGIGAWLKPGRGSIPYAWEVIMNYYWMAPAMQEFFYSMATPNDYFIGCLSGPGYMYPKAVPPDKLPRLIEMAGDLMKKLDLRIFEIMDYSEGATVEGNTELTKEVVDAYYKGMPDAIGFLNGYAPAFTFTCRDGRPLISYDYYLSPTRTEADAVADLQELAAINKQRPYFLLVHVRESSDVARVKSILDKLGDEFEVIPLDIFIKMAGEKPTFKEKFLKR